MNFPSLKRSHENEMYPFELGCYTLQRKKGQFMIWVWLQHVTLPDAAMYPLLLPPDGGPTASGYGRLHLPSFFFDTRPLPPRSTPVGHPWLQQRPYRLTAPNHLYIGPDHRPQQPQT
jgi:hypothetical protein